MVRNLENGSAEDWSTEIKAYRERHGLTQEELGRKLGLTGKRAQGTLWGWENGRMPRAAVRVQFKKLLDGETQPPPIGDGEQNTESLQTIEWHKKEIARKYNVPVENVSIEIRW